MHNTKTGPMRFRSASLYIVQHKTPIVAHNRRSTSSIVTVTMEKTGGLAVL